MNIETQKFTLQHYYGDIVRGLFLISAVIMLVFFPNMNDRLGIVPAFSIFTILILALAAGLTNPKIMLSAVANVVIASAGFVTFEFYAVRLYRLYADDLRYFVINLALGFIFLIAIYFSTKTMRAALLGPPSDSAAENKISDKSEAIINSKGEKDEDF